MMSDSPLQFDFGGTGIRLSPFLFLTDIGLSANLYMNMGGYSDDIKSQFPSYCTRKIVKEKSQINIIESSII